MSYARTGPWVIVSVRDHGQGVDPKKLDQLTTPFFRGDAARTAATGAGLGLAIVEKAVQRMGGAFELDNAADGGLVAHIAPEDARAGVAARRAPQARRRPAQQQADRARLDRSASPTGPIFSAVLALTLT